MLADPLPLLRRAPVVPVLTIERLEHAVPLARALVAGGLPLIEVTLRTAAALDAARAIAREVPEAVLGIGTLAEVPHMRVALAAGAKFLVTPGTPPELAAELAKSPVPVIPGCATPSEAMALSNLGFTVLKFFPAVVAGGIEFLRQIAGPLPHLKFLPSGGVNAQNAAEFLRLPNVVAVGGTWVAPADAIEDGDFAKITALARAACALRG
jgi:2-dehydro-3-deoxyphosphogluconate aldolase/(4S)-4-hydroxy-2-oxoglutarate aldolase